jgi:23S rRNA (adenine2503-C2)-methyltransferase
MNLIPYNTVEGLDFKRPAWEAAAAMARALHRRGVLTKLRRSAGQDVDGGCGQLRARSVPVPGALPGGVAPPGPPAALRRRTGAAAVIPMRIDPA